MTYNVHIYAVVRVKVENVLADSPEHATKVAQESVDLNALFENVSCSRSRSHRHVTQVEYAGDVQDYVVDEVIGEEVQQHTIDREHRAK